MTRSDSVELAILQMQNNLNELLSQHKTESWLQKGNLMLAEILSGDKEMDVFGKELMLFLAGYTGCTGGTFYKSVNPHKLELIYAHGVQERIAGEINPNQSYFSAAINKNGSHLIEDISTSYFNISASLLNPGKGTLIILPLYFNNGLNGIIELSKIGRFSEIEIQFLEESGNAITVYLNTLIAKGNLEQLLDTLDTQEQELQNRISAINKSTLMIEYNPDGFIIDANESFLEITEFRNEELIGQHHRIFAPDEHNYDSEYHDFWSNLKKGDNIKGEFRRKTKSGKEIWLQASYTPVFNKEGAIYKIIKIGYDISLLKNQQIRIEEISLSLKQQIEVLNKAAIVSETDSEGNITYVNDLFCEISEYSREELIGKNHRLLKSGKQPDGLFTGLWAALKKGLTWQGEILNVSKNGNYYWVDSTITPFKNNQGEIEKFVAIRFDISKQKESEALKKQTEALLLTQKELEESNTELEAQAQKLQASEEELRVQQEELMQSNKELDEKRNLLEEKNYHFNLKNIELISATESLKKKSEELELSSKYKSEFLANMSHELRTPLNSIILLSRLMTDNLEGNLSEDQQEYVQVINKAGNNLLELINDILDLSKIESGKMDINPERINLSKFRKETEGLFNPISREKQIEFSVEIDPDCPETIFTDRMRIEQVIKNFLSNAFKFCEKGKVKLRISNADYDLISFSVSDNGIGIPKDKQALIFEAFQQADGSTKRKYGGTGLGLSISREIAHLLGGSISLQSEPGKGSTFTISIPIIFSAENTAVLLPDSKQAEKEQAPDLRIQTKEAAELQETIHDDRDSIEGGDKTILIVEDDAMLAKSFLKEVRKNGFKVLVAMNGLDAGELARKFLPSGIILDINLPGKSGWEVLKEVKELAETSSIPVHIVSSEDIALKRGLDAGASSVTAKPLSAEAMKKLLSSIESIPSSGNQKVLLLSDKEEQKIALRVFLNENGFEVDAFNPENGLPDKETCKAVTLIILDVNSRKTKITGVLENLKAEFSGKNVSVIILSSTYLSSMDQKRIDSFQPFFPIKILKSYSDIAEELQLFFSYLNSSKAAKKLKPLLKSADIISGKKILIVDDDEQNLFSIGKLLKLHNALVIEAKNGSEAVEKFSADKGISLILTDVMMPVMDGYEAVREIRKLPAGKDVPIITLTAKNQADEREKCLQNGSSDFITKPLDADQLISLVKVWLSQSNRS